MRVFAFALLIGLSFNSLAQDTYVKSYDFFNEVDEATPRDMFVIGDEIHILGIGDCDRTKCLHYYVFDYSGEIIRTKIYQNWKDTLG